MHTCPVCGFGRLEEPPERHMICPCCGTQFAYHDSTTPHGELRNRWIAAGALWFDRYTQPTDADSERLARIRIGQGVSHVG